MHENQNRHAYLIIAHTNFEQLQTLIDLLDDARNDIYLHIDKRVKTVPQFSAKHSGLYLVDSVKVIWGGHSQIQSEMVLLEAAGKGHYQYYHLLSGMDLPLKTQDYIHTFFRDNNGKEYIYVDEEASRTGRFAFRTQYYHIFANVAGNGKDILSRCLRLSNRILVALQKLLHIKRKDMVPLYKGANWFSITDAMVQHVLTKQALIKKQFYYSLCGDEVFLQSLAMASDLHDQVVGTGFRAIDWNRGMPYTYRKEDVDDLLATDYLWARKFDQRVDAEAIQRIAAHFNANL